jgi:malate-CoA ligase subunit beta
MDIHEYQAKELLSKFGVPIPRGGLAYSPEQATYRANEIGGSKWAVKAQIHSGARGKAGGIKLCRNDSELWDAADQLLGKRLATVQTGPNGKIVSRLYIEEGTEIDREFYLSYVMDRAAERIVVVASAAGGMDIEEISHKEPDSILRVAVDPAVGMQAFQARELAFGLGVEPDLVQRLERIILGAYRAFRDLDATLVEINPLVITKDRNIVALDAKMSFDENALFRRPQISELRDKSQEDPRETYASDRGLSYVGLDGDIGCVVNGAGLAMATLDMIKVAGGEPANFLDIGGGASPERVQKAFRAVLKDKNIKALLVNVFAGINRCDWVAKGVVEAIKELEIKHPVIVRLAGTNVEEGRKILEQASVSVITADTLGEAAEKAVAAAKSGAQAAA